VYVVGYKHLVIRTVCSFIGRTKFRYVPGTTYVYNYTADTLTSVRGATKEKSQLHLSATASFHVVSECDFVLQVIYEYFVNLQSREYGLKLC
jgi:hypothetical protein